MSDYQAPPPPPPPPGYGAPGPMGYGVAPKTDGMAIASLVLGILSITCIGLIGTILAVVFGILSRKKIKESGGALKGEGLALAGIILGIAGAVIGTIVFLSFRS